MRTGPGLRTVICLAAAALLWPLLASAEDPAPATTNVAPPSADEPAIPPPKPEDAARESEAREAMCLMIELAARASSLPLEFFARVIWQESRFQSDAVGPVTRNGQRAQGIAQFMPGTANERGLLDPFNPVQALPKSAEFLSELRDQFGNLGLAAAAYNAGPKRVQDWLAGSGYMPQETRNYVLRDYGLERRRLGGGRPQRQDARTRPDIELPRVDGAVEARAQSVRHGARTAHHAFQR